MVEGGRSVVVHGAEILAKEAEELLQRPEAFLLWGCRDGGGGQKRSPAGAAEAVISQRWLPATSYLIFNCLALVGKQALRAAALACSSSKTGETAPEASGREASETER